MCVVIVMLSSDTKLSCFQLVGFVTGLSMYHYLDFVINGSILVARFILFYSETSVTSFVWSTSYANKRNKRDRLKDSLYK